MDDFYPQGAKSTWQTQANAILGGEVKISESDIPKLLEWLKDMNWPGAETIAKFLVRFGPSLLAPVREVLHSGDAVWISWVLASFKDEFDFSFWVRLTDELKSIAGVFDEENAHISALIILAKWSLVPTEELKLNVERAKNSREVHQEDYDEVYRLLNNP